MNEIRKVLRKAGFKAQTGTLGGYQVNKAHTSENVIIGYFSLTSSVRESAIETMLTALQAAGFNVSRRENADDLIIKVGA
jgi:hypothetical protein